MIKQIKCDNYYIIKIRYYGSPYYMKKFHSGDEKAIKNHYEAAKNHNDFFWKFIKKITKHDFEYFISKYYYSVKECVVEEIRESHGIIIVGGEGYYKYFLPKNKKKFNLLVWMKDNCKNKSKFLLKTNTFYISEKPETFERDRVKEMRKKYKK